MVGIEGEKIDPEKKYDTLEEVLANVPAHYEIRELEKPMQEVLEQMRTDIEKGEYTLLIGDDASGRIPTRIVHNFLKEIYEKRGFPNPRVQFFAGSGQETFLRDDQIAEKELDLERSISKIAEEEGEGLKKALIITDTVVSGGSLAPLTAALKKKRVSFDIATFSLDPGGTEPQEKIQQRLEEKLGGKVFYSTGMIPRIYGKKYLSGVEKNPEDLFSKPLKPDSFRASSDVTLIKKEARKDAKIVAHKLAEWFEGTGEEKAAA